MIKIYDEPLATDIDTLISALEYIENNIPCDIVNLSLGVQCTPKLKELYQACGRLREKGVIIVSAFDNGGAISFPAAFDNVIGVDASDQCFQADEFEFIEDSVINLRAKGGIQRLAWVNPQYILNGGSSFAAAYVTAYISKILQAGAAKEGILESLRHASKCVYYKAPGSMRTAAEKLQEASVFKPRRAVLFPYNKEIHSIINFSDLLDFEIAAVCDVKYTGRVGTAATSLDGRKKFIIENIMSYDWENVDTLVLGHVSQLSQMTQKDLKEKIILQCLEKGINIYSFDSDVVVDYKEKFDKRGLQLYWPKKDIEDVPMNQFGRLYKICSPVLGVFGTTSQQGKFTLQLQLRRLLLKDGYKLGQMGTEPSALLFGMNEVYPMGYSSTINLDRYQAIMALNLSMHRVDKTNPDIILVGCQSGTSPLLFNNMWQLPMTQLEFLLGTMPDAVVLCINPFDDISYIKRTIGTIENLTDSKVVALSIFPFTYANQWSETVNNKKKLEHEEMEDLKTRLKEETGLSAFEMGNDEDLQQLYDLCLNFFEE